MNKIGIYMLIIRPCIKLAEWCSWLSRVLNMISICLRGQGQEFEPLLGHSFFPSALFMFTLTRCGP